MPALNISNIKDAKLGSTDLSAVYKGSTPIWQAIPSPPFIFAPINIEPRQGKEMSQYTYWACYERNDSGQMWFLGVSGVGTDPSWPITSPVFMTDPNTGTVGECVVDGIKYRSYSTNNNRFTEKDDCDWIIKLKLEFREYGWTPESVILKGGIDDPDNPCYRDDRFPDLSTFYIAEESELEDG